MSYSAASAGPAPFGVTGTLAGSVVDAATKEPLVGVNIVFVNTKYGGTTNEEGKYKVYNIPAGSYTVQFSYIGYKHYTVENVRINADETTLMNVELELGELALEEVVVTAERLVVKQDITGTSHIVESEQFKLLPIDDFMDVIATQPGVTRDLHIRGGRQTEIQYLVDGLPYTEVAAGAVGGMLPKSSILEMKILTGGFDAEYGNAMSGVVNIVTRRGTTEKMLNVRTEIDHYFSQPETDNESLIEVTAGGPVFSENATFFTATDFRASDTRWNQDFKQFFNDPVMNEFNNITKFDYNVTDDLRLNFQAITSMYKTHDYEFRWRKNLDGLPERKKFSNRVSVGVSKFLSEQSFINLNVSHYYLNTRLGPDSKDDLDTSDLWEYDFLLQYVVNGSRLWWADEKQHQWTLKGDLTTQLNDNSSVKAGFEATYYDMNIQRVKYEPMINFYGKPLIYEDPLDYSTSYKYSPISGAAYIQNKYIFMDEGTLNLGVRYDFLDARAQRPNLEWVPVGADDFEKEIQEWVPASKKHQFSPRLGFSMPASPNDFFLANIGYFFQVPLFDYLYSGLDINLKKKNSVLVGNPDMKPMNTLAKELSYRRKINEDMTFTLTWFDKDTENLIDTKTFIASDSKVLDDGYYAQYVNSPYAHSTGLELTLEKFTPGPLYGRISYSYMKAEGVSERSNEELRYIQWGFEPVNRLYPLSWDQRHTVNALISTRLPDDLTCDLLINYHSPRPYTYYPSPDGFTSPETVIQPNNERMENNLYIDFKVRKSFEFHRTGGGAIGVTCYVDVRNLLDRQNVLWIASDGRIGGELGDPAAYDMPRRTRIGFEFSFR